MAYDVGLAERIREALADPDVAEKAMFGGLAFLVAGHMAVAASGQGGLLVRVDPDEGEQLIAATGATAMVMQGRSMKGWLRVEAADVATDEQLETWVGRGVACARALPAKAPKRRRPPG